MLLTLRLDGHQKSFTAYVKKPYAQVLNCLFQTAFYSRTTEPSSVTNVGQFTTAATN